MAPVPTHVIIASHLRWRWCGARPVRRIPVTAISLFFVPFRAPGCS